MKKIVFFICCGLTNLAFSQNVEIGPVAFTGISSTRSSDGFSFEESGMCFGGGLALRFKLAEKFFIATDLLYDRREYRHKITLTGPTGQPTGNYYAKTHREYGSIPLFLNMRFGDKTKFILNAGTYLNYLIRESFKLGTYNGNSKSSLVIVENDQLFDSGVLLGVGLSADISSRASFQMELRNCIGLIDVSKKSEKEPLWLNSHYLFIGFNFKMGKA